MKKFFFFSLFFSFIYITAQQEPKYKVQLRFLPLYNPHNTVIHMDIDGVVIDKSKGFLPSLAWQMKTNPLGLFRLYRLYRKFQKSNDGSRAPLNKEGHPINGVTYQLFYGAMQDKKLLPYIVNVINTIQTYRVLSPGTEMILKHLKQKGYTIFFATNKDHYGYLKTMQALGKQFSEIPHHVICCEPGNTPEFMNTLYNFGQQKELPQEVKKFFYELHALKQTNKVHYAPWPKPLTKYWESQRLFTQKYFKKDSNPYILFFDDKQENINGINNHKDKKMQGYHFTNPTQFSQKLIQLDILDPNNNDDQELLKKLSYLGFLGGIKQRLGL